MTIQSEVCECVLSGEEVWSIAEFADQTGRETASVAAACSILAKKNLLERVGKGLYRKARVALKTAEVLHADANAAVLRLGGRLWVARPIE